MNPLSGFLLIWRTLHSISQLWYHNSWTDLCNLCENSDSQYCHHDTVTHSGWKHPFQPVAKWNAGQICAICVKTVTANTAMVTQWHTRGENIHFNQWQTTEMLDRSVHPTVWRQWPPILDRGDTVTHSGDWPTNWETSNLWTEVQPCWTDYQPIWETTNQLGATTAICDRGAPNSGWRHPFRPTGRLAKCWTDASRALIDKLHNKYYCASGKMSHKCIKHFYQNKPEDKLTVVQLFTLCLYVHNVIFHSLGHFVNV